MLQSLAKHYSFDVEQPWEMLDERIQELVLHGSGGEKIAFRYPGEAGRAAVKQHPFEGVMPEPRAALPRDRLGGRARGARQAASTCARARNAAARGCGARRAT